MTNICTILLITYNHAPYIKKALDSVLEQKTEYGFVVHIFDDASTDGTSDIIREYAQKYPDTIIPFWAQKNQGAQTNIWNAYKSVKTKYCALLECDDYWCDENKLQLQIEALENHPECSFCACQTKILNIGDKFRTNENKTLMVTHQNFHRKSVFDKNDFSMLNNGYMNHISSRLIRTCCIDFDSIKNKEVFLYDNCQFYYLLTKGSMFYINRTMHCYIQTGKGVFSSLSLTKRMQTHIKNLIDFNEETNFEMSQLIFKDIIIFLTYYTDIKQKETSLYKQNLNKYVYICQQIKRYFLPRFVIDIIDLPFHLIKLASKKIRKKGETL